MTARWELLGLVGLLGGVILVVEVSRWRTTRPLDVLRLVSLIYLLAYVVVPLQYSLTDLRLFRAGPWAWVFQYDPRDDRFVLAAALGLISYLGIVMGWHLAAREFHVRESGAGRSLGSLAADLPGRMLSLGAIGTAALVVYTIAIGGPAPLLLQGAAFRTNPPVVTPFAFLRNIAPLAVAAAFVGAGLLSSAPRARWLRVAVFGFWLVALVVMFHRSARLPLVAFLVTIPIASSLRKGRVSVPFLAGVAALFLVTVAFGKEVFARGRSPGAVVSQWRWIQDDFTSGLQSVLLEFSFPFVSTGNATVNVPLVSPFRYFSDVVIAPLYLAPQRLTGMTPPPTVSSVNTELLHAIGTIPSDLVTFGWYSLGLLGVVVCAVSYGGIASIIDGWVRRRMGPNGPLGALGVAWMLFTAFCVMYADPQMVLEGGFYLYVATAVVFMPTLGSLARGRQPAHHATSPVRKQAGGGEM